MQFAEKQELVRLLSLYQTDLLKQNDENIMKAIQHKNEDENWRGIWNNGVKAQYEHCRIIIRKLSVEIGKEIKSYWDF